MNKILLEKLNGIIVDKYLPEVFEDGQYLEEENVHYIVLKIKVGDIIIKLVKDRNSYYSDLFVDDKVILNKYAIKYNYQDYIENLRNEINKLCLNYDDDVKKIYYRKSYISEEEFNKKPRVLIDYEIIFE